MIGIQISVMDKIRGNYLQKKALERSALRTVDQEKAEKDRLLDFWKRRCEHDVVKRNETIKFQAKKLLTLTT